MGKLTFAVIGCGNIGQRHIAVALQHPDVRLIAVCDVDSEKCLTYRDQGISVYRDFRSMLEEAPAALVSICTPHHLHAEMAIAAAEAGRHVLVEKPMALSVTDCRRMISAARKNEVCLSVVMQNRYNAPVALAYEALGKGWLGEVYMMQCNVIWNRNDAYYSTSDWRGRKALEGGALFTQASHFIDMMCWWFGPLEEARPLTDRKAHNIEIEDCGAASLRFRSGVLGSLFWTTCNHRQNYEGSITVIGEKGTIRVGGQYLNRLDHWEVEGHPRPDIVGDQIPPNDYGSYSGSASNHARMFEQAVALVQGRACSVVSGEEGMRTVEAIERIYESVPLHA